MLFIIFFAIGYFIIYKQVALVKKGEFSVKDRLQCLVFGFIFSIAVMVVISMAFIFAVKFWETQLEIPAFFLLFPFIICLGYISFYPLIDFLFIALSKESDEGLTFFHKIIGVHIINKGRNKIVRVFLAIGFYFAVFFLPPILFSLIGLPFIMIWISWMLVYPLMILTFFGSKGYIAGISNCYYHIPNIQRSIFLNFENRRRGMKQFTSDPGPYILIGLMLFVFVWAWISMFQTLAFFFTGTIAISTMSSVFVFVTLLMGILGYFSRFWNRKIKYRGIDLYFAAYLIASIGINVLINFLIVNPDMLKDTFDIWIITNQIMPNYRLFAWAAAIEEIVLIIFTTYFFLARNNKFITNIKYSKITECGRTFDPVPIFNFLRSSNYRITKYAEETLILMFERLPLKSEMDLNEWKFKNSLLDGICDNNLVSQSVCIKILTQLERDVPTIILPWIIEALISPNYDKSIPIARTLLKADYNFIQKIPKELIFNLVEDPEWRLKLLMIKVISRLSTKNKDLLLNLNINNLINDSNSRIQTEILKLIAESSLKIPVELIINKMFHTNKEISAAAIKNIKNLNIKEINRKMISKIIPLLKDPSSSVRASIFEVFTKIGNFKKNNIPILPFLEGLTDSNENTRIAAVDVLEKYFEEESNLMDIDSMIKRIDLNNFKILKSVISLLGRLWSHSPKKVLTTLLTFIKFENDQLKKTISDILIDKYSEYPDLIVQNLIKIPDVSKFITKGIISKTLINIGERDPKTIIQKLYFYLNEESVDVRLNAIETIDGLCEDFLEYIEIKTILKVLEKDKNNQVKKKASNIISKVAKKDPFIIKPYISDFFQVFDEQELSVRIVLCKSVLEIAKKSPEIIPVQIFLNLLSDQDSFIRETSVKILGFIGYKLPVRVVDLLINKALVDNEWIVRDAAVISLGEIINHVEKKELIIEKLVSLLDDQQNWVRRSAMNILSNIKEVNDTHIPFENLIKSIKSSDPKVREASAGLIKIFSNKIEDIFEVAIKLLGDEKKEVRSSSVNSFVEIIQDIGISRILTKLLQNLSDEGSLETQRSIALILGRTVKFEEEKIKKRVISLLKIRCEMSQDPIICETLQKLKEN